MVSDGFNFIKRARLFMADLKAGRYPNSTSLGRAARCAPNTAQRTIYRLRDEYFVPLKYDPSKKGYFLTNPDYLLPEDLPPGKDELTALLLACDLVRAIDSPELHQALEGMWRQFTSANPAISRDIDPLAALFSSTSTTVAEIADTGLLTFLEAARAGESVRIEYKSPWRHSEPKTFEGRIERVHLSDGTVYLLFRRTTGHGIVLNASFVKNFTVLDYSLTINPSPEDDPGYKEQWFEGYGVWSGEELNILTIEILPPAAEYYASQRWHEDQQDSWDGPVLIRKLPGVVSPEIVRRVLSLGEHVRNVAPAELKQAVIKQAEGLVKGLCGTDRMDTA